MKNTGSTIGGEVGGRVWRNLDGFIEGGAFSDVVTTKQLGVAAPLTAYLQQTQGKAAASHKSSSLVK